jgi:hypothetical protein
VVWLQRAASAWAKPIEAVAACRRCCSTISAVEASLIDLRTGLEPARPAHAVSLQAFPDLESALPAIQGMSAYGDATP